MHMQNFKTLTQSQLHEKDIERHRISWSVQTHTSQTHRHTDRQPHPQTTPRVSVETYSTRGETVGYNNKAGQEYRCPSLAFG